MALVGMSRTCRLIATLRTTRYRILGICADLANNSPVPVDLYILNRLSHQFTRLQSHPPPPLPPPLWRG